MIKWYECGRPRFVMNSVKFFKDSTDIRGIPKYHQYEYKTFPWASTTIKIMVDPISMIKTLR